MIGLTIPVVALSSDGIETSDRVLGLPCIRVGFSWDALDDPAPEDPRIRWTFGQVDTGATVTVADHAFVDPETRLPLKIVEAALANGLTAMPIYRGTLVVTSGKRCITIDTEFATGTSVGPPYRMLLGRHFLQFGTFTYNRAHGIEKISIWPPASPIDIGGLRRGT